jgi:hypothetical protein
VRASIAQFKLHSMSSARARLSNTKPALKWAAEGLGAPVPHFPFPLRSSFAFSRWTHLNRARGEAAGLGNGFGGCGLLGTAMRITRMGAATGHASGRAKKCPFYGLQMAVRRTVGGCRWFWCQLAAFGHDLWGLVAPVAAWVASGCPGCLILARRPGKAFKVRRVSQVR